MYIIKTKGTITANGQSVATIDVDGFRTYGFAVTGAMVATLRVQVTIDDVNWQTLSGNSTLLNSVTGAWVAAATVTTAGLYVLDVSSYTGVRITSTAWTSGNPVIVAFASDTGNINPAATQSVSGTVTANQGTLVTGTTYNLVTAASTNLVNARSTAGNLFEITVSNPTATPSFVKLYNKATAPVVASDVPVLTIPVPANSVQALSFGAQGKRFATGISLAATGAIAATDATATVAGIQINATHN